MSFVASTGISPTASTGVNVYPLPRVTDISGNAPYTGDLYSHVRILAPSLPGTVSFDNVPGVSRTLSSITAGDVFAIPPAAQTMTVNMGTGGLLAIQFGRAT
jgi:hypothetical protein